MNRFVAIVRVALVLSALILVTGCEGFVGTDPMDRHITAELDADQLLDHPTALGVLALVNDAAIADLTFLDEGLSLDVRAAERIVAHRQGPDGLDGTADDDLFNTVLELEEIPYVGDAALLALAEAAWEFDYVPAAMIEGVVFSHGEAEAVLMLINSATLEELDDSADLDVRAAEAIITGRPYAHVAEVSGRPHVGPAALRALVDYCHTLLD